MSREVYRGDTRKIGTYRNLTQMRGNANCLGYYFPFSDDKMRVVNSSTCCNDGNCCACKSSPLQRLYPGVTGEEDRAFQCWYSPSRENIPDVDPRGDYGMNCSGTSCNAPCTHQDKFFPKHEKEHRGPPRHRLHQRDQRPGDPPKGVRKINDNERSSSTSLNRSVLASPNGDALNSRNRRFPEVQPTRKPLAEPSRRRDVVLVTEPTILPENSIAYGIPPASGFLSP